MGMAGVSSSGRGGKGRAHFCPDPGGKETDVTRPHLTILSGSSGKPASGGGGRQLVDFSWLDGREVGVG